ncbi:MULTISPECIES: RICIN domain-containing protein [unclassified Burkholderia]|uniref:RICIN domain-containing protein n=1 Tax=unclassified Burkholderia TaxID=2613784 RepID=UPI000F57BC39|nr:MULTISPECIES: RICIN domain-containing protein [unclassified Burkholderia]RQR45876.1 hypothetical protein DIE21_30285 [Burkholderia sp. Bp9140]
MAYMSISIQFTQDPTRVLGVAQNNTNGSVIGPNAPLQLRYLTDPNVQTLWDYDPTHGAIILDFSEYNGGGKLAVDFNDGKVAPETPLVLRPFTGAPSQRWSISIRPGYITSLANTSLVFDDHYDSLQADNLVWAYPYNGTFAQQWTVVPAFQAVAERAPQSLRA